MQIIFNPPDNTENKYIQLMTQPLRKAGYDINELDTFFTSWKHFRHIRLVHLNWFENIDDTSTIKAFRSFFRKIFVLTVIRLSGKKLVWTMHNRMTHEKKTGKLSRILTGRLLKWSDAIVIHCSTSRELLAEKDPALARKTCLIPHPNFVDSYGSVSDNAPSDSPKLHLLFMGAVKPYKNIELLINTIGPMGKEVSLTIAGKPKDSEYHDTLTKIAAKFPNIDLVLEFIPDGLLPELIGKADILILPYDLKSSLNSGTVMLAFSYQKTVICPEIGTLVDLQEAKDHFFGYRYQSTTEHMEKIRSTIQKAINLKKDHPTALDEMGQKMREYVLTHNSQSLVGKQLVNLYENLSNQ
ncbi:glycosyltransferase [Echinicola strongylocentroti]|uniref:Glycosyltransferase n=1 Tax=Echinicola strongylocentroti TaxID=1795355 RepID=A0A2Z4IG23_9BACT|nr:glycosyltransferase [Echinicola strongylocentroti]AWW29640.1 glycosyltransferase [Echinicola strongylocentroti]